jgi:hypothetical protein
MWSLTEPNLIPVDAVEFGSLLFWFVESFLKRIRYHIFPLQSACFDKSVSLILQYFMLVGYCMILPILAHPGMLCATLYCLSWHRLW